MTLLEQNIIDVIESIADHTPVHADELRRTADRVRAMASELDSARQSLREAAVLVKSQRDEIESFWR